MMRLLTFVLAVALGAVMTAQDDELVPAPYLADRYTAPANAPYNGELASGAEPGERLVVTGRVLSGARPVAAASLFIFQTDSKGEYAPGVQSNDAELNPRLHVLLRTDAQGRYRFESVRPGSYGGNAAHVHYIVKAAGHKPRLVDLWFQDDPILVARRAAGEPEVTSAIRNTPYYKASADVVAIRPVSRDSNRVWHATRDIQMFPK